ncbi:MAG: hypothetical protein R3C58_04270 [Parvularculaceae bacterium]
MPLMGVVRKLHRLVGTALAYKMILMAQDANVSRGVVDPELSWIFGNVDARHAARHGRVIVQDLLDVQKRRCEGWVQKAAITDLTLLRYFAALGF